MEHISMDNPWVSSPDEMNEVLTSEVVTKISIS